jgi:hypothetical protein
VGLLSKARLETLELVLPMSAEPGLFFAQFFMPNTQSKEKIDSSRVLVLMFDSKTC